MLGIGLAANGYAVRGSAFLPHCISSTLDNLLDEMMGICKYANITLTNLECFVHMRLYEKKGNTCRGFAFLECFQFVKVHQVIRRQIQIESDGDTLRNQYA